MAGLTGLQALQQQAAARAAAAKANPQPSKQQQQAAKNAAKAQAQSDADVAARIASDGKDQTVQPVSNFGINRPGPITIPGQAPLNYVSESQWKRISSNPKYAGVIRDGIKVFKDGSPGEILYVTGERNTNSVKVTNDDFSSGSNSDFSSSGSGSGSGSGDGLFGQSLIDLQKLKNDQESLSMERAFGYRTKEADQGFGHQTALNKDQFGFTKELNLDRYGHETSQQDSAQTHQRGLQESAQGHEKGIAKDQYTYTKDLNTDRYGHEQGQQERGFAHQLSTIQLENSLADKDWKRNRAAAHATFRSEGKQSLYKG